MGSFLVSKEDVKNFVYKPTLSNSQGIYFLYSAPPEVIKKIIPPPLTPAAPVVLGYILNFGTTTFGGPYMESMIATPCNYKDMTSGYAYNLMLYGHGAENGTIVGDRCCGIPKKTADGMEIHRVGDIITAKVERHGVTLIECEIDLGQKLNVAAAENFLGSPTIGEVGEGTAFYHTLQVQQTEEGNTVFDKVQLVMLGVKSKAACWETGKLTKMIMRSSPDDPFGELEVLQPMGAVYFENEFTEMSSTTVLEDLDPDEVMPYLMTGRYDRALMGDTMRCLRGFYQR